MKLSSKLLAIALWINAILLLAGTIGITHFSGYRPPVLFYIAVALLFAIGYFIFKEYNGTVAMIVVLAYTAANYSIASLLLAALILCKRFANKLTFISKLWFVPAVVSAVLSVISYIKYHLINAPIEYVLLTVLIVVAGIVVDFVLGYWFVKENGVLNKKKQAKESMTAYQKTYFDDLLARGVITKEEYDLKIKGMEEE